MAFGFGGSGFLMGFWVYYLGIFRALELLRLGFGSDLKLSALESRPLIIPHYTPNPNP